MNRDAARLVGISFATLFLELALIRFINSTVQVIAYFNNFLILSAFLGIGFGCVMAGRKTGDWLARFPILFAGAVGLMVALDGVSFRATTHDNVIWVRGDTARHLPIPLSVLIVFCANFSVFAALGNELGAALARFENKLAAYAWDLFGSFLGVIVFGLASYWQTEPVTWFAAGSAVVVLLMLGRRRSLLLTAVPLLAIATLLPLATVKGTWSPYYKVTTLPYYTDDGVFVGHEISVDKLRIQDALHFSPALAQSPLVVWVPYYRLPYQFRRPKSVLVLGGGAGNDATIALAEGAREVTVVEIDPVIVAAGYTLHPHKPYRDPRVRVVNDDARAFLRRDRKTYDLIVMNALDSHHQLPGLSTLRLESFMYTTEAFRDVKKRMAPDSLLVVHLASDRVWMGERLYASLTDALGAEPRLFTTPRSPFRSIAFVYGPRDMLGSPVLEARGVIRVPQSTYRRPEIQATDDWPHLYLRSREIPRLYLLVLGLILAITAAAFWRVGRLRRRSDVHFFLLGTGFMLLEARSITKASLLFGATWLVNAVVIVGILLVVFAGNLLVLRGLRMRRDLCYLALFATLLLGYFVPVSWILDYPFGLRIVLAALWLAAPIFFTSIIFSEAFARADDATTAFGANLLGVVAGGVLEYSSMLLGLNALYLIALGVYVTAASTDRAFGRRSVAAAPVAPSA
ncbi:MAG TPA: hypothetical protein VNL91_10045 [Thermoanaerobaculia bacterium]|nr:hypothetical protein [Thermoanaerobaculia bacterium]